MRGFGLALAGTALFLFVLGFLVGVVQPTPQCPPPSGLLCEGEGVERALKISLALWGGATLVLLGAAGLVYLDLQRRRREAEEAPTDEELPGEEPAAGLRERNDSGPSGPRGPGRGPSEPPGAAKGTNGATRGPAEAPGATSRATGASADAAKSAAPSSSGAPKAPAPSEAPKAPGAPAAGGLRTRQARPAGKGRGRTRR